MGVSNQTGIKSIQRGLLTIAANATTGTATITAVDTAKTQIRLLGASVPDTGNNNDPRLWLNNSTTIAAIKGQNTGFATDVTYEVTEWY